MANFKHLLAMSDERGVFEHAFRAEPKRDHGYCSDDVGRALVVAVREPEPSPAIIELGLLCTRYLAAADLGDGRYRNRMNVAGEWGDEGASDDASGRAIWGIGSAFARGTSEVQAAAAELVDNAMLFRSPFPRATAVAVLGAAEVLHADPTHDGALLLLQDALFTLPRGSQSADWPWPEDRLRYANALFPDALSAAGFACGDTEAVIDGLDLLAWLVEVERRHDHFSFTPTGGWAPGEPRPGFDQQPIEAATLADACWRAWEYTHREEWLDEAARAIGWFHGFNDTGIPLAVPMTGGGMDGLKPGSRNENQGAESTISLILADQIGERIANTTSQAAISIRRSSSRR
jgi:hypothetical protein